MEKYIRFIGYKYAVTLINTGTPPLSKYKLYEYYLSNDILYKNEVCSMKTVNLNEWDLYISTITKRYWLLIVCLLAIIILLINISFNSLFLSLCTVVILYYQWKIVDKGCRKKDYPVIPRKLLKILLKNKFKKNMVV